MRSDLVEPGPHWEAALRYLGLAESTPTGSADLPDIVLAIVDKLQQLEARIASEGSVLPSEPTSDA